MMGPINFSLNFRPGTLVKFSNKWPHKKKEEIGTIVDNFVNFDIKSGAREEKALVMWASSKTEWVSIGILDVIDLGS